jgi:hypothetical protein
LLGQSQVDSRGLASYRVATSGDEFEVKYQSQGVVPDEVSTILKMHRTLLFA